jgi:hypothetical protein
LFSGLSPGFDILFSSVVVVFGELTSQGFSDVSSLLTCKKLYDKQYT